jgi:Co/Zn/Cd efflux system component
MAKDCCGSDSSSPSADVSARFRRVLWIALAINAVMFVVELAAGWKAESVSLLADAVDFLGDAANYAVSLFVLGLAAAWRSRTALLKGTMMGGYGLFVVGRAWWAWMQGDVPDATTMGIVGFGALIANVTVAVMLYAYREGDANMRSVWLCSRNDAFGNIAVMLAALGVAGTASSWPDLLVAIIMAALGLSSARSVITQAMRELRAERQAASTSATPL